MISIKDGKLCLSSLKNIVKIYQIVITNDNKEKAEQVRQPFIAKFQVTGI